MTMWSIRVTPTTKFMTCNKNMDLIIFPILFQTFSRLLKYSYQQSGMKNPPVETRPTLRSLPVFTELNKISMVC